MGLFTKKTPEKNVQSAESLPVSSNESVNNKRGITSPDENPEPKIVKTGAARMAQPQISTYLVPHDSNRFSVLASHSEQKIEEIVEKTQSAEQKPPPVFVYDVKDIKVIQTILETTINKNYTIKCLQKDVIKIQTINKDDYKLVINEMRTKHFEFHSYQLKSERSFRVVLKNLHYQTNIADIKAAIEELGHNVNDISQLRERINKKPMPIFFINLATNSNNKDIYKVNRLLNMVVKFEPPKKQLIVPQCTNCQHFGHTKAYCNRKARCVKCPENHKTADCTRTIEKDGKETVVCVNCGDHHAANFKGCQIYQELKNKMFPQLRTKNTLRQPGPSNMQPKQSKPENIEYEKVRENMTFADILKTPPPKTVSNDMAELKDMMKQLMNQMSTMLNLLTTVIAKMK